MQPNDIVILASRIELLQQVEDHIYSKTNWNCTTAFETLQEKREIYKKHCKIYQKKANSISTSFYEDNSDIARYLSETHYADEKTKKECEKLRKIKKHAFNANTGQIKICTIHSFKGFECKNVFYFLDSNDNAELAHTAITRSTQNLIIINMGNTQFDEFFSRNMN